MTNPTKAENQSAHPFTAIKQLIHDDPEYAWAWHCNMAVPIMDTAGVPHKDANRAAAHIMAQMFDFDITAHPHYRALLAQWSKQP